MIAICLGMCDFTWAEEAGRYDYDQHKWEIPKDESKCALESAGHTDGLDCTKLFQ